jgi:putative cardiolipin synthase
MQKAREGVKIRLLIDQRGSLALSLGPFTRDYLPSLASFPNVQVRTYNAFRKEIQHLPASIRAAIASSHAKMLIVDGEWVVAGGRNVQQHWFASPADDPEAYHDADFLARGAALGAQARRAFEGEYGLLTNADVKPHSPAAFERASRHLESVRRTVDNLMHGLVVPHDGMPELVAFASMNRYARFTPFPGGLTAPVVLLAKNSAAQSGENAIAAQLLSLIAAARREITVGHAYMVLTDRVKAALKAASDRGVRIRYITNSPESTDSFLTQARFVKEWKDYLRDIPRLSIEALARGRKLHGKMFVLDRRVVVLGSYNMDPMSETVNAEDAAVVRSTRFAGEALAWLDTVAQEGIQYRIRIEPDGSVAQVVGPSDHCRRAVMALLAVVGWFDFLRPLI